MSPGKSLPLSTCLAWAVLPPWGLTQVPRLSYSNSHLLEGPQNPPDSGVQGERARWAHPAWPPLPGWALPSCRLFTHPVTLMAWSSCSREACCPSPLPSSRPGPAQADAPTCFLLQDRPLPAGRLPQTAAGCPAAKHQAQGELTPLPAAGAPWALGSPFVFCPTCPSAPRHVRPGWGMVDVLGTSGHQAPSISELTPSAPYLSLCRWGNGGPGWARDLLLLTQQVVTQSGLEPRAPES